MQLESSHRFTPVNLYQPLWDGEVIHIWNPVSKRTWLLPGVDVGLPTAVGPSWKGWKLRPVPVELCTGGVVDAPVFITWEKLLPVVRSMNKWEYRNKVFVSCSTSVIHFTYVIYLKKIDHLPLLSCKSQLRRGDQMQVGRSHALGVTSRFVRPATPQAPRWRTTMNDWSKKTKPAGGCFWKANM